MIEEFGTIIEIKSPRIVVVECVKHSACQHCPSSSACQLGDDNQSMQVEALNRAGGRLHDRVKVVTSAGTFLRSSFLLYIVPILALLFGAYSGQELGPSVFPATDPSLLSALAGVTCLVMSFLVIRLLTRRLQRERYMPTVDAIQMVAEANRELS